MSQSTHVIGFKPPDKKYTDMKAIWDACVSAGVSVPEEVEKFFGGSTPDGSGVEVSMKDLKKSGAIREFEGDMVDGWEIIVDKVPRDVKVIRVYTSY